MALYGDFTNTNESGFNPNTIASWIVGYTEFIAGVFSQLGIIGRKYMGHRLLTGEF